jgi:hypothetical protein
MYTQGSRPSCIHGHMSQHTAKAPALHKIRLRQAKAHVNAAPGRQRSEPTTPLQGQKPSALVTRSQSNRTGTLHGKTSQAPLLWQQ